MDIKNMGQEDKVIKISFRWLLLLLVLIIGFGMLGGWLAGQIWKPVYPLITASGKQVVTTTQEVVISPNLSAAENLKRVQRSVVMIGKGGKQIVESLLATGVVVTSDGLIVTTGDIPKSQLLAFDFEGRKIELDYVGEDELFGLTYLRLKNGVLSPLDIRMEEVSLAVELLVASRNITTFTPRAEFYRVHEYLLPPELMPAGRQSVFRGTEHSDKVLSGSPLIDEEGRLAGMLLNPAAGLALPANQVKESMQRVVEGRREFDPFVELGFTVHYSLLALEENAARQLVAEVEKIERNSPAAAEMKVGDIIVGVEDKKLAWNESLVEKITRDLPLKIELIRGEDRMMIVLNEDI
jgi:S1-C subfamily serine protease